MTESNDRTTHAGSLRVAHVGWWRPDTAMGPLKAIEGILHNLPSHGVDVELWQFDRGTTEATWKEIDGIRILDLPSRPRFASLIAGLPKQTEEAVTDRSRHVDLVHFHSVFIPENVGTASLLQVPYVISPRGGYNRAVLHGRNRIGKLIWLAVHEKRYIASAQALHAVSVGEASELEALAPRERIFCIPNGMDQDLLEHPVHASSGRTLLFLGRLDVQHKGIDLLLAGFSEFLRKSGDGASDLVIAGPDSRGDEQQIRKQIQTLGLHDRVSLTGGVFGDHKLKLIEQAYAFVLTSRWEGMPFALLEALTAGKPVLVTPETNMGTLIEQYEAGFKVAGDPHAIAEGIASLLALPAEEYLRMQQQARRLIRDRFTWQSIAGDLADRYREILGTS